MVMTPVAKEQLSKTIRALRTRLLEDFKSANDTTYKYSIRRIDQAKLSEANATRRRRIEEWVAEQTRGEAGKKTKRTAEDFRRDLEKQAAYTLLNRMLILRLMEAMGLHSGDLVSKGWNSEAYKSFRYFSQEIVGGDESEGYSILLQMVFDDLAIDMPGLYGTGGISDLIPVPSKTLRAVIEAFADATLETCWTDDMTLGWVYQYWNDPEREALDEKINDGGKIEPHEIASKTQMFTERYMVDWLLQNSLGPMWLAMCKKQGWSPLAESTGTLEKLEQRRVEWRAKREAGEVALTELMPMHTQLEQLWAYYVPQVIPEDAIVEAPETVRELKILDPAVGSGHFLVVAFDLLFAMYNEESVHRGEGGMEAWSSKSIVEKILENNLHGIDLDPRAVQIAAAALWLKAKTTCREAHPGHLNLVASNLQLASLPDNDPALIELRSAVENETGMPAKLTDTIVQSLRGADHLGSLLQIDKAVDEAITHHETSLAARPVHYKRDLFGSSIANQKTIDFDATATRQSLLEGLERFLQSHTSGEDLGLRTRGEQLAVGVRFMRMLREGQYNLIVANPPYQGSSKLAAYDYIEYQYPLGKADLYAAFLLRGLQLVRDGGVSSMLTMRNWMFIKQFSALREHLLTSHRLRALGDFDRGAFEGTPDEVVAVAVCVFGKSSVPGISFAACPTQHSDRSRDNERTQRKRAATLCHVGTYKFDLEALKVIPEWPLIYWWDRDLLYRYETGPLFIDQYQVAVGLQTGNNYRFVRSAWEVQLSVVDRSTVFKPFTDDELPWKPYVKGAAGVLWVEPLNDVIWYPRTHHPAYDLLPSARYGQGAAFYGAPGVAFTKIGAIFSARRFRYASIFDVAGSAAFGADLEEVICLLNSAFGKRVLMDLNPTVNFQVGDVKRLAVVPIASAHDIWTEIESAFGSHESHREPSVEFKHPGPSPWRYAQEWAQLAVDQPHELPLPKYVEVLAPELPTDHLSFALGVALGRFDRTGKGILDPNSEEVSHALPSGILFLNGALPEFDFSDSLGHVASRCLHDAWSEFGSHIVPQASLRDYLREKFFSDIHKSMYENRPIHWPLSSAKKTFVAWINIHRWNVNTLRSLLADHLQGNALPRIDGELEDLRQARAEGAKGSDARFLQVQKWKEELDEFIALVKECAEKGPPPTDDKCPTREVDARYDPKLDDGVMINSAALWPLLEPQWKDPKKWWKELAVASSKGNKDYDWSHLAIRYFPKRVDEKCKKDPSLGVAHGCFWKYHPAKAWAWELRLQDEVAPDFRIEEASYRGDVGEVEHRATYLRDHTLEAIATIEKEVLRRRKDALGKIIQEMTILEPGLWSTEPEACWDMESRIIKKQEFGFRLIAPDEAEARAKLISETPQKETGRRRMLEGKGGSATYLAGWEEAVENS